MIFNYPYYGFRGYGGPYRYYYSPIYSKNKFEKKDDEKPCLNKPLQPPKKDCSLNSFCNEENRNCNFKEDDDEVFEIFGIKLHFDDLLIIALLFFLYKEEVKDQYLYISLILLLLS